VSSTIFLEGGGDHSKELQIRCREGFRKLLERCGFEGRMPRLYACGGRKSTFEDFITGLAAKGRHAYMAMLIDSEEPVLDEDAPWSHLKRSDDWDKPPGATDEQVLLMTTCMETWIITDRAALVAHHGKPLQSSALPSLTDMEQRARDDIQDSLIQATRLCSNSYRKGKHSFEILGKLSPEVLEKHLPSFKRARNVLKRRLR
jgi:hypothetical protein